MSSTQPAKSHNFAAGKKELAPPMANVLSRRKRPMRTRVRETGSGSFGSNGGRAPGGRATIRLSREVSCVISGARIASNEVYTEFFGLIHYRPEDRTLYSSYGP